MIQGLRIGRTAIILLSLGSFLMIDVGLGSIASATGSPAAAGVKSKPKAPSKVAKRKVAPKRRYSARRSAARRAKLAHARATIRAREAKAVAEPRYKMDDRGSMVPDIRAEAAIIYNPTTGEVLWEENSLSQRSLASITKAMTAIVFMQADPDLELEAIVEKNDVKVASTTYLRAGDRLKVGDLMHLLLIASDNAAARVLARISEGGSSGFIQRMNDTARDLGLASTQFVDPSGLSSGNVSSAYDISRLIVRAVADERIAPIMRKAHYAFATNRRTININSTNKLLEGELDVRGGKTGFITKAGYCMATLLKLPTGDQVAVVVLGARSNAGRFMETKHLFNWMNQKAQSWIGAAQTTDHHD